MGRWKNTSLGSNSSTDSLLCGLLVAFGCLGMYADNLLSRLSSLFPKKGGQKKLVEDRMHELSLKIWKCKYLCHVCHNPPLTDQKYNQLVLELDKLEEKYPSLRWSSSPIGHCGFEETLAKLAYGDEWDELKRTWDLLKKDYDCLSDNRWGEG